MKVLENLKNLTAIQRKILISVLVVILIGSVGTVTAVSIVKKQNQKNEPEKKTQQIVIEIPDEEEPQSVPTEITLGIDVSEYQGTISWEKVAAAGIDFAMIRIGCRTLVDGKMVQDETAEYNMQEATKYGIKVGAYFFSTAISEEEAVEEADFVADIIDKYRITYPVAYDCEGFDRVGNRQYSMSIEERTDMAIVFLNRIVERGYSPLFYGSKSDMEDEIQWDMERISSLYSVWVAQYPAVPYPETTFSTYSGSHVMWQYTSKGKVPGIKGNVDMNVAYFGYANAEPPKSEETPEEVKPDVEAGMGFQEVEEQVTAKEKTNLRDIPSQGTESVVKYTLLNGEIATRTGVSPSGWSRVVYNGNVYYALTSLLTTDLGYKPPADDDDGIKTEFETVNIQVTPKEAVNLRQKPSVDDTVGPVVVKIENGMIVTKTGVSKNGWARVVYEGQTLYCIDSYLEIVEQ